jgi:HD-GYP domain-containing protein (c-di-GMP phosphodiesterase class II)
LRAERERFTSMITPSPRQIHISSLLADIWDKSREPREHGERMAASTCQMSREMGLPEEQVHELMLLARIHDLGKTMLPDKILKKPGPLDQREWAEMKMHPVFGARIAHLTPAIRQVADGILYHHERWDGQGYPHGLAGPAIPLAARMITVADAFDVMTHDRPYRPGRRPENALTELRVNAGLQFDPAIIDVFVTALRHFRYS